MYFLIDLLSWLTVHFRNILTVALVVLLAACGGGGGASDLIELSGDSQSQNYSSSLNDDTLLIQANEVKSISIKSSDSGDILLVDDVLKDKFKDLQRGEAIYIPPGMDTRFPFGVAGVVESTIYNSKGQNEILLKPAGMGDIFNQGG